MEKIRGVNERMYDLRRIVNIFYYNIFRFECVTQDLIGLPISVIAELIGLPRRYADRTGKDWEEEVQKVLNDPKGGASFYITGIHVTTLVSLVLLTLLNVLLAFLELHLDPYWLYGGFAIVSLSVLISWYMFPTDRKKYLKDFRSFDGWSKARKRYSALITFAVVLTIWLAFIGSFIYYLKSLVRA